MSGGADQATPAFPIRIVVLGVAAMVAIALASAATAWIVGKRIRTIANSQIEVITATEKLQRQSELLEVLAESAIASGNDAYAYRYGAVQPQLRQTLQQLSASIRLAENRATFARVAEAEREIAMLEYRAIDLATEGSPAEARRILGMPRYRSLVRAYRQGVAEIEARARAYVRGTQVETNRYLTINFASSMAALLLLAIAWFVLVRPARSWAQQLGEARKRAEAATQAKTDFLAVMSHEIRTPLNSIIGFADLLRATPSLRGEQRRQVELIHSAGAMLLTVVNDLLDFSKIEAGRIELLPEPFALETLVDNSVSIVRSDAEAKGLEMRIEIDPTLPPYLLGDENRLRQVLLNLLNNAVKFTASGTIGLSITGEGERDGKERLRFTVTDTGVGIDPDRQQHLFQPFAQADASITRRFGGTGLGLSISKRLVELMGGRIGFESRAGEGSSFFFTVALPRAQRPPAFHSSTSVPVKAGGGRILLVEDLPMNQELGRAMLRRGGHEVEVAENGAIAVEAVRARPYDLILMDIQMPVMDGITATKLIRQLPGPASQVPIVAMTANVLPEQVTEFLAAGMNGHVAKPVNQRDLHAAIAAAMAAGERTQRQAMVAQDDGGEEPEFDAAVFRDVQQMLPPDRLAGHVSELRQKVRRVAAATGEQGESSEIEKIAHQIVSQAGMLGLVRLSARAREVETALRESHGVKASLARFRASAEAVEKHLV